VSEPITSRLRWAAETAGQPTRDLLLEAEGTINRLINHLGDMERAMDGMLSVPKLREWSDAFSHAAAVRGRVHTDVWKPV
jgi:hypothetical protein